MSSIVGTAYAKAEGKTEKEMKAILYGWCVKCKRILGRKKADKYKCPSFLPSFINTFFNKPPLSICSLHGPELEGGNVRTNRAVSVFQIIYCPGSSNGRQRRKS